MQDKRGRRDAESFRKHEQQLVVRIQRSGFKGADAGRRNAGRARKRSYAQAVRFTYLLECSAEKLQALLDGLGNGKTPKLRRRRLSAHMIANMCPILIPAG